MLFLKLKLNTLIFETRIIKKKERHTLENARGLSGIFRTKHNKDENPPKVTEKELRASHFGIDNPDEAQKAYDLYWGLTHHRKNIVRKEARDTHIALAFLRGQDYFSVEQRRYSDPDFNNVERMVLKYGEGDPRELKQRFEEWVQAAGKIGKGVIAITSTDYYDECIGEAQMVQVA